MKKTKHLLYYPVALLMSFIFISSAQATVWSSVGGGCVPEDPTIEKNIHFTVTGGMRVKFRPGASGSIKIVCPITIPFKGKVRPIGAGENSLRLNVYYQDPDGVENNYRVKAHLRSVRLANGAISTLCTADSNVAGSFATWSVMSCSPKVQFGVGYTYWVQIEIFRQFKTNKTVEINAVELVEVVG